MCGYVLRIYVCLIRRWNVGPRPNIDVSSYVLNLQGITPEHVRPSSPYRAQMFVSLRVRAAERICLPVISMSTERARIHGDRGGERERERDYLSLVYSSSTSSVSRASCSRTGIDANADNNTAPISLWRPHRCGLLASLSLLFFDAFTVFPV